MRIGFDARLAYQTGVGRYIRNLVWQLSRLDQKNDYVIYVRRKDCHNLDIKNNNWQLKILDLPWHSLKEQLLLPGILSKDNLDVMHFPYFNVPLLYRGKFLLTVHDLIVDHFATGRASTLPVLLYKIKRLGYYLSMKNAISKAAFITTISESTKRELLSHYHLSPQKVKVTYDALDNTFYQKLKHVNPQKKYQFPYVLYVGNAYPHKNLERLVLSFRYITPAIKLVLAGDDNYFFPRLERFTAENNLAPRIIFHGFADDEELIHLYSYAKCLVFPSLMEGFGLPNLEALSANCLPVVSDIAVFREIWNNNLDYFNPWDETNIAQALNSVIHLDKNTYHQKVNKAKEVIKKFNWTKTAKDTLTIYKKIYAS